MSQGRVSMKSSRAEPTAPVTTPDPSYTALRNKVAQLDRDIADGRGVASPTGVNSGLKMILVTVVVCVTISWLGTLGNAYIRHMTFVAAAESDEDSLRTMCAVNPPKENEFNRLHLCEIVASGGATVAAR